MANQIRYQVGFNVNKSDLDKLKSSLKEIQKIKLDDIMKINTTDINSARDTLKSIQDDASKVESALNKAFNTKLNTLNIDKFNKQLSSSNLTIEQIYQSFSRAGASGQAAFNNLSTQILNTNVQLRQSNKLLDSMATSMANTIKWGITSSVFNNMTRSIQQAYYYAKDLDRSLTNIRIVTGDSAEQMQRFADTANSAAKELGRSTLDYTKASLTFYQQGLDDQQVAARTEATLKAQNITGIGTEMADYLTAVWNGFNVGAEEAEQYVDKLAAVADSTASDMGQLATAMSKVASAANSIGVDMDQLNGQIATVIATTRQAPESVGAAFKTIYARINDIQAGTEDAQVSLGNYSGKMAELGFNVLDATGHLRDTGEVIEEIGGKWQDLTREQQINLAQTMAGQRQYNNLIALFDNWDKYLQAVNTSMNAQGTLNEKNDRYLESLEAHMQQLGTQAERTYDILFDENAVKSWVDALDGALGIFNDFISGLGGGTNAFAYFGTTVASIFNKQIAQGIQGVGTEIQRVLANIDAFNTKSKVIEQIKSGLQIQYAGEGTALGNTALTAQAEAAQKTLAVQKGLTTEQQKQAVEIQKQIGLETQKIEDLQKQQQKAQQTAQELRQQLGYQRLTVQQIQKKKEFLEEQHALTLQTKNVLDKVDITLKTQTATEQQKKILAKQISDEQQNIVAIFQQQNKGAQDLENKTNQFKDSLAKVQDYLNGGKTTVDEFNKAWNEVYGVVNKFNNDQITNISKTETLLQNLGIDTSKLTEEEKKRLVILLQQNDALAEQGKKTLNLQTLIKGVSSAGMALTSIGGGLSTALADGATAADKLNGAFTAVNGSIGAALTMIPGFGPALNIAWQGVSSIGKAILQATGVWQKFEDAFKSTSQRIEDMRQNMSKVQQAAVDYQGNKAKIESLADEFQTLSKKAGQYNQHIASMTEEQQQRYREIIQEITDKNPSLIEGYTSQGDAIINNNTALQRTLELLDKQYQKQMALLYSKDQISENAGTLSEAKKDKDQVEYNQEFDAGQLSEYTGAFQQYQAAIQELSGLDLNLGNLQFYETEDLGLSLFQPLLDRLEDTRFEEILKNARTKYANELNDAEGDIVLINQANKNFLSAIKDIQSGLKDDFIKTGEYTDIPSDIKTLFDHMVQGLQSLSPEEIFSEVTAKKQQLAEAAKEAGENYSQALNGFKTSIVGALIHTSGFNSGYKQIKDKMGNLFTDDFGNLLVQMIQDEVNNFNFDQKNLDWDNIDTVVSDFVNNNLIKAFENIDSQSLTSAQTQLTNLSKKLEEGLNIQDYQTQVQNIFNRFRQKNAKLFEMLASENKDDYDVASTIIEGLFGDFGIKVGQYIKGQEPNITSSIQDAQNGIRAAISNAISSGTKGGNVDQLYNWLTSEYDSDKVLQVFQAIKDGTLVLSADSTSNLQNFQAAIRAFFTGIAASENEDDTETFIKNFDKINKIIDKVSNDKDLTYKEKINLMNWLGLDENQVQSTEEILNAYEAKIKQLADEGNLVAKFEGLSNIFTDFETLANEELVNKFGVTTEQHDALWQNIFDSELEALGIEEQALKNWATNRKIVFDETKQQDMQGLINSYKINQSANSLQQLAKNVKDAGDQVDTSSEDFIKLQTQLERITGEQWTSDAVINMLDSIAAYTDDGIQKFETYAEWLDYVRNNGPEGTSEKSTASQYKEDKTSIDNLEGASKSLTDKTALSQDQSQALAELIAADEQLSIIAEKQGINSQAFLEALNAIIEAKNRELEITKEQALQENKAKQQQIQKQLEATDEYGRQIAQGQYRTKLQNDLVGLKQQELELQQQIGNTEAPEYDADINVQELQHLSDTIQQIAQDSEELDESLTTNEDAADELAQAILRFDDACKDVSENYENWMAALNSGSLQEQVEAMDELRDAYGDLLDLDGSTLSQDFLSNTDNLNLMKAAIDGDVEAYNELLDLAGQDIAVQIGLDASAFEADKEAIYDAILDFTGQDFGDIQVGAQLNDQKFLASLSEMVNAASMTQKQATDYLAAMGVDAQIVQTKAEAKDTHEYTNITPNVDTVDVESVDPTTGQPITYKFPSVSYDVTPAEVDATKENSAFALKVVSANKASGGSFKFKNATNGGGTQGNNRRNSSPKRSGGGGKPKGSSSKKPQEEKKDTSTKDRKKGLEDQRDIYHDINIQIQQINRSLNRTQKMQDRLYGKQLLDNLAKQQQLLQKQKVTLREKQKIQEKDLENQQQTLRNLGVTFDQYNNISNYMSILGQKQAEINARTDQYNAIVDAYNASTDKDQKEKIQQSLEAVDKEIKLLEDQKKNIEDKIKDYDNLRENMEDLKDKISEATQQQIEIQIKKFRMNVEIRLEMGQAERDWNRFRRQVLERPDFMKGTDFDSIFADATQNQRDLASYFKVGNSIGSIQTLTNKLWDTKAAIDQIDKGGTSAIYGDNKALAMEHLQKDLDELMQQLGNVEDLIEAIDKAYLDTIDDIQKNFDEQIEDYEFIGDLIDHDIDLLTILYGDKNYDAMEKYYTALEQNNNKTLDSLRKQAAFLKEQWQTARANEDTKAAEKFEAAYKKTIKTLNSQIQESAKIIQQKYENSINNIFDTLDKKISNGKGTDYLSMEWQLMNKNEEQYLDTINSAFAIQETQRKYNRALNETKSIKNQQALKKLMDEQLGILKNKNKLTQYDIDRAEKLLQVEQARIALEQTRSSKTSMRLKRNSQGDYSYEYVADQGAIGDAEENLAKAQNDLYNFDKDAYKQNLEDMLSAWKEFLSKRKEILLDNNLTEAQQKEQLALLDVQYGEYINGKTEQNLAIRSNLTESAFMDIAAIYNSDLANYQQMADGEKDILMGQLVPMWESGIQQMSREVAEEGGFIPTCQEAFENIDQATKDYKDELGSMAEAAGINLGDVQNGVDELAIEFEYLVEKNDSLIERMNQELEAIMNLRSSAKGLVSDYNEVVNAAKNAVSALHSYAQAQRQAAAADSERAQAQSSVSYSSNYSSDYSSDFAYPSFVSTGSSSRSTGSSNSSSGSKSSSSGSSGGSNGSSGVLTSSSSTAKKSATPYTPSYKTTVTYIPGRGTVTSVKTGPGTRKIIKKTGKKFDTGGYTGDWNSNEGRLAILHQKELVLNQTDTKNFLNGVSILREINSTLNGNMFSMLNGLSSNRSSFDSSNDALEQNVHIEASFPNVNSKKEIEEAFSELVNMAAQRAMRR